MKMNNFSECVEFLKSSDRFEIYTHTHPDGDAIGSSFALAAALKKLGKKARVVCLDTLPEVFSYIYSVENEAFEAETTVTVDVADRTLLGDFPEDKVIDLALDHHKNNRTLAKKLFCDPERAACGEIVFDIITSLGVELDRYIAECLYTALATDTGCFKFSNANSRTFETVAKLCRYAENGNFGYLNVPLFITKSPAKLRLETQVLSEIRYYFEGRVALVAVTDELLKKAGVCEADTGGIEQLAKIPEGVVLGITLKEREGGFKVSMRSSDSLDCSLICAHFGGGGHHSASGCFISAPLEEAVKTIISYLEESDVL